MKNNSIQLIIGRIFLLICSIIQFGFYGFFQIVLILFLNEFSFSAEITTWLFWEIMIIMPGLFYYFGIRYRQSIIGRVALIISIGFNIITLGIILYIYSSIAYVLAIIVILIAMLIIDIITLLFLIIFHLKQQINAPPNHVHRPIKAFCLLLLIICSSFTASLGLSAISIQIIPQNYNPQPIFLCDYTSTILQDPTLLNLLSQSNSSLVFSLNNATISQAAPYTFMQLLINHKIGFYIFLYPTTEGFQDFVCEYNYNQLDTLYNALKFQMLALNLFNQTYFRGICLDVEASWVIQPAQSNNTFESLINTVKNSINSTEIQLIRQSFTQLKADIQNDGKEANLVSLPWGFYETDSSSYTISSLTHTIANYVTGWNRIVIMTYRTVLLSNNTLYNQNIFIQKMMSYGGSVKEGTQTDQSRVIYSDFSEYLIARWTSTQKIADNMDLFIGCFDLNNSLYNQNPNEIIKDIQICKSFHQDQIWFFRLEQIIINQGIGYLQSILTDLNTTQTTTITVDPIGNQFTIFSFLLLTAIDLIGPWIIK